MTRWEFISTGITDRNHKRTGNMTYYALMNGISLPQNKCDGMECMTVLRDSSGGQMEDLFLEDEQNSTVATPSGVYRGRSASIDMKWDSICSDDWSVVSGHNRL